MRLVALFAVVASSFLPGCAMYNYPQETLDDTTGPFDFHVIQADDQGSLWSTLDAQRILDRVQTLSQTQNTLIVLFIHGWHHNAAADDPNLLDFRRTLTALNDEISKPKRQELRLDKTGRPSTRIVGIYVGWRGRSLPWYLDYFTFWGRKPTAERVGEGDVSEFIERLQRLYLRANATAAERKTPIVGLVTIGHSFGGQVLWKSLGRQLEIPLAERAPRMSNSLTPSSGEQEAVRVPIDSLGDLNILVNPALEAYQFARVDALYRQLKYPSTQTPQVIVFSAENDTARALWFPLARGVTWPFRPTFRSENDGYQGQLYGKALGDLEQQLTHDLTREPGDDDSLNQDDLLSEHTILDYDFTKPTSFDGIRMSPRPSTDPQAAGRIPYSPVLVVESKNKIIDGHNGIFQDGLREFLTKYVSFIEAKRLLLRASHQLQTSKIPEPTPAASTPAAVTADQAVPGS
jgi:hypothetical protein